MTHLVVGICSMRRMMLMQTQIPADLPVAFCSLNASCRLSTSPSYQPQNAREMQNIILRILDPYPHECMQIQAVQKLS